MLEVFLEVVLPVGLVAAAGGVVGRWRDVPVAPISTLVFYLFSPALVFDSLAHTEVSAGTSFRIAGVMFATFLVIWAVATAWSTARRHDPPMRSAYALAATSANAGNMGLPVALLAFGQLGFDVAVMNFVIAFVMQNTLGIAIASMAGGSRRTAMIAPLRYPAMYAAAAGVAVNAFGMDLPVALDEPVSTLATAAVPAMLTVLGLQLQHATGRDHLLDTFSVNAVRLLVGPTVAWFAASALGLDGVTRGTLTVLAAMPTAVVATILATEFKAVPSFVTRAVVTSTLASMLTLSVLISLVR